MQAMKIATWNIKQAVAPKKPLAELWDFAADVIGADVMVFTEGKVPGDGAPDGWTAVWRAEGIDPKRKWGTVIAARNGVELVDVTNGVDGDGGFVIGHSWPGTVTIVDVVEDGETVLTIAGVYGITQDADGNSIGSGAHSVPNILNELVDLINSPRGERLVIAGDFNLWPRDMPEELYEIMIDVVEDTSDTREPLEDCSGCSFEGEPCGHMWTHKNGNGEGSAVQNIDYVFIAPELADVCVDVYGGEADFEGIWEVSDHAPVVVEFEF
jgi:exonuclease III